MEDRNPLALLQQDRNGSTSGIDIKLSTKENHEVSDLHDRYRELTTKGKTAAAEGNLEKSLAAFKEAYEIRPTDRIKERIKKIEDVLAEIEENDSDEFVQLDNGLIIYRELVERLYPHQITGVKWMYNLQKTRKKGGILADDMGLGKTIQVISALSAMFDMELIKHVLLVLPLSLIPNWQREFEKWSPGIKLKAFYGSVRERTKALEFCQRRPSVCITTYGLVQTKFEQLGQTNLRREFVWDYIILDEGHKIKNPSKTTKGLHTIPSKNRLILTGTPIQNNLRELWALFDWVTQGTLLGTQKTFRLEYETPITRARQRGASSGEIHLGNYMSESLQKIIEPYMLRRTKGSVSAPKPGEDKPDENMNPSSGCPSFPKLKKKNDFVVWTYLSSVQEEIYRDFLAQDSIKELLASKRSPLVYLTILKKICDHPRLLPRRACHQLGLEANDSLHEDDFHTDKGKECAANRIDNISDETLIQESGKLQFLLDLLKRLREEGHRTLIFSLSRKILNIIHRILLNNKFKVMRLDGTVSKIEERELRVKKFQQDSSYEVFLLTTQVGGVGLTLTAADRVVIFDPSWNPATDAQAVDRIYRIGQDKNVVVYRLITCGTVEEKIYRRQIFKDSIIKQSTGDNKDPYRYFTNHELKELFQLTSTTESETQKQLQELHGQQRCLGPELDEHIAFLHSLRMYGVSDHDLMFSQSPDDIDEEVMDEHRDVIQSRVAEARNKVECEARQFTGGEVAEDRWGNFNIETKPYEPKAKEVEPKYEIEGLYDKMDSLKMEDVEAEVENIFNQSKISINSEPEERELRKSSNTNDVICLLDSEEENLVSKEMIQENTGIGEQKDGTGNGGQLKVVNGSILAADSPMRNNQSENNQMGTLEIGESFMSDFEMDESRVETPEIPASVSTSDIGLLNANISCIPDGRISRESDEKSNEREVTESHPVDVEKENLVADPNEEGYGDDFIFDDSSYGDFYLPGSSGSSRAVTPAPIDVVESLDAEGEMNEDGLQIEGFSSNTEAGETNNQSLETRKDEEGLSKNDESNISMEEDVMQQKPSGLSHQDADFLTESMKLDLEGGDEDLGNGGFIKDSHPPVLNETKLPESTILEKEDVDGEDERFGDYLSLKLDETGESDLTNFEKEKAGSSQNDSADDSQIMKLDESSSSDLTTLDKIDGDGDEEESFPGEDGNAVEDSINDHLQNEKLDDDFDSSKLEDNSGCSLDSTHIQEDGVEDSSCITNEGKMLHFSPLNDLSSSYEDSPLVRPGRAKKLYLEEDNEAEDSITDQLQNEKMDDDFDNSKLEDKSGCSLDSTRIQEDGVEDSSCIEGKMLQFSPLNDLNSSYEDSPLVRPGRAKKLYLEEDNDDESELKLSLSSSDEESMLE